MGVLWAHLRGDGGQRRGGEGGCGVFLLFSVSFLFSGFLSPPWVSVPLSPVSLPAPSSSESLTTPPPFSVSFSLSLCPLFLESLPPFGGLSLPSERLSPQSLCSLLSGELSLSLRFPSFLFGCLASSGPLCISFLVFGDNDCIRLHQVAALQMPKVLEFIFPVCPRRGEGDPPCLWLSCYTPSLGSPLS